jgi:AcrR family transcriptional regulator
MVTGPEGARPQRSAPTRAAILQAARQLFAREGFERATIRAIAAEARIDPSMVMRYYGSKELLFAAAADIDLRLPDLSHAPRSEIGATAVRLFLDRWERDPAGDTLIFLLRSSITHEAAVARMQQIFREQVTRAIAAIAGPEDAELRAGLVATQLMGLALCRYVLRLPPIADLDTETLAGLLGPTIQRYIVG